MYVLNTKLQNPMPEKEPLYFKKFREHFETHEPLYFKKFKEEFNDFVDITAKSFDSIEKRMATKEDTATKSDIGHLEYELSLIRNEMATKQEVHEMLAHIGRYEVRSQNAEDTIHNDHKPRIIDLEKKVFV